MLVFVDVFYSRYRGMDRVGRTLLHRLAAAIEGDEGVDSSSVSNDLLVVVDGVVDGAAGGWSVLEELRDSAN